MNPLILLILLLILFGGGISPYWSYSSHWGYGPSGGVGLVVLILIIWLLVGRR